MKNNKLAFRAIYKESYQKKKFFIDSTGRFFMNTLEKTNQTRINRGIISRITNTIRDFCFMIRQKRIKNT